MNRWKFGIRLTDSDEPVEIRDSVDGPRSYGVGFAVAEVPPGMSRHRRRRARPVKATAARLASLGPDGLTSSPLRG